MTSCFVLIGRGLSGEGLAYMSCAAEIRNINEPDDSDFNANMTNMYEGYSHHMMPIPVTICKYIVIYVMVSSHWWQRCCPLSLN